MVLFTGAMAGVRMYVSGYVTRPLTATYSVRYRLAPGRTAAVTGKKDLGSSEDYRFADMDDEDECRFHVGVRSYLCSKCGKCFGREQNVLSHYYKFNVYSQSVPLWIKRVEWWKD